LFWQKLQVLVLPQKAQKEKDKWNKNSVNRCQKKTKTLPYRSAKKITLP